MKRHVLMILTATVLLLPTLAGAQFTSFAGSVSVDMVQAEPGQSFEVNVRIVGNDLAIAGMQLPLKYNSPHLTLDSVSYTTSLKPGGMSAISLIDNASDSVAISFYPNYNVFPVTTMPDSEGILATMHFTLSGLAPVGTIAIDSIYHGNSPIVWSGIGFSDALGEELKLPAAFIPGQITVQMPTGVDDESDGQLLPNRFEMAQNYPNPFNPTTVIEFALPTAGLATLEVFNVLGQKTAVLLDQRMPAGVHQVEFDAASSPSGIYFYRLSTKDKSLTKKMILIK
ncbi:MAG: T9SS type A sorting domain-containing protein [candidate division Zixibacteria bacterium]|nr:T9SS type A sorting domain-containing protein [candidate division Zixibacteria bacterium]MDH3938111.1 T9SS type A sorting domain-containing protein [candidate division Zixibacteria bacterium]MDH4034026.1 T9SS type A sorting domain-containing protein [candidate division Zixibacteria bacterium]